MNKFTYQQRKTPIIQQQTLSSMPLPNIFHNHEHQIANHLSPPAYKIVPPGNQRINYDYKQMNPKINMDSGSPLNMAERKYIMEVPTQYVNKLIKSKSQVCINKPQQRNNSRSKGFTITQRNSQSTQGERSYFQPLSPTQVQKIQTIRRTSQHISNTSNQKIHDVDRKYQDAILTQPKSNFETIKTTRNDFNLQEKKASEASSLKNNRQSIQQIKESFGEKNELMLARRLIEQIFQNQTCKALKQMNELSSPKYEVKY